MKTYSGFPVGPVPSPRPCASCSSPHSPLRWRCFKFDVSLILGGWWPTSLETTSDELVTFQVSMAALPLPHPFSLLNRLIFCNNVTHTFVRNTSYRLSIFLPSHNCIHDSMWTNTLPQNSELKEFHGSIFERSTTSLDTVFGPVAFYVYGCGICHSGDRRRYCKSRSSRDKQ